MTLPASDSRDHASELIDVKSEQIKIALAATPLSLSSTVFTSIGLASLLWPAIDHSVILTWLGATNLVTLIRLLVYFRFKKIKHHRMIDYGWYQYVILTSAASGLTWGLGCYYLYADHSLVHQVFLVFVIAGLCAAAITSLSSVIEAACVFVVLTVLPLTIQFAAAYNDHSISFPMLATIFVIMVLISAKRINQTIVESLETRHQRELAEQTIRHQAHYDELTDLPNRRLMLSNLRREMARADRHKLYGAIFFIDLDRFKLINDSLGHSIGDKLLVKVAQVIERRLRKGDSVARMGGDEFVVLLPEIDADQDIAARQATSIADQIRKLFENPFLIDSHDLHITISVGIALFPLAVSAEDLLKYADVAMYRAKNDGRDNVRLFSTEMQEAVNQQRVIEKGLRQALVNDEFELYLQSQHDSNDQVIGAETLLRWNHPDQGVVAPGMFIAVAEQTGLIVPIGEWVLRSACELMSKLDDKLTLAVNVSPRQFSNLRFIEQLKQIILETNADPSRLKLEITEGLAMANIEHSIDSMNQLKQLGISFSIDDFGTGYSSLSYLNSLPIDELKIDQSFVRDISSASDNAIIVDTIIAMAQKLNLTIVAEGVETKAELDYLKARECQHYQGFYFSKPLPYTAFIDKFSAKAAKD